MTQEEFLKELLKKTEQNYEYFCGFQKRVLKIFDITHSILIENGIQYYTVFGSLIGLVRDKGMVPWDYDFDIMVSIDDAKKVIKILEEQLPEDYCVLSNYNDKTFPFFQARVCEKGFHHCLHVDIFYFFGLPSCKVEREQFCKKVPKLFHSWYRRHCPYKHHDEVGIKGLVYIVSWWLKRIGRTYKPTKLIEKDILKLVNKYPVKEANQVATFSEHLVPVKRVLLGNPTKYCCYGHVFLGPQDIEGYLDAMYKNFRQIPNFETRYEEYINGFGMLRKHDSQFQTKETEKYAWYMS